MLDKLKQMMEIKKQAEQIKRELENTRLEMSEGRGIKITIDGVQRFHSIEITDDLLNTVNKEKFEIDLLRSINAAIGKSQAAAAQKMKEITGLNIPGL